MRSMALYCLLAILAAPIPHAAEAAITRFQLNIPRQSLDAALNDFSRQTRIQVARMSDQGPPVGEVGPLSGAYEPKAALEALLKNTGLGFQFVNDRMVRIYDVSSMTGAGAASGDTASAPNDTLPAGATKEGKAGPSGEFRVAQVDPGQNSGPAALANAGASSADKSNRTQLQEVVVTAQKREERLQDVPVPVTAVTAQSLMESNQVRLQDYYTRIPGLTVTPSEFNGSATISIRGITSGDFTNPTVGITVDDVPYGSSTALGGGYLVPDLDPSDLARIEVLRGPQGTLYGASSIGGLLKYITVDPSTERVGGRVQAGIGTVRNGAQAGYNFSGSINLPVTDTIAIRATGFTRRDPGFIDNVQDGRQGANEAEIYGGHISSLWRPSDALSVKLSAMLQDSHLFGSPYVTIEPGTGDLQQDFLPRTGLVDRKFQLYSAILKARLGVFDLTSVTGYSINNLSDAVDYTQAVGAFIAPLLGVSAAPNTDVNDTDKFSQEFRLTAPVGSRLEWLLGGFYTHERSPFLEQFLGARSDGQITGTAAAFSWYVTYAEIAGFTDLTWHVTDQIDIQLGGRESQIRQSYGEIDSGPYVAAYESPVGTSPLVFPEVVVRSNAFTYVVTPQYKIMPDLMLYARLASGFRPGGPNPTASVFGLPESFNPDKTQNYEVGLKGNVLDHRLAFDGSLYYIDWKDIQLSLVDQANGLQFYANGGRAKSEGVELSIEARPITGLRIDASATWNEAVLREPFPAESVAVGNTGDRLPYSSRYSGNLSVDESIPLGSIGLAFVGATESYVGDRIGAFTATAQRQDLPAYARTDLRAGLTHDTWTATFFVNNLTDRRGLLGGGVGTLIPSSFEYIQPRTIGLTLARTF